MKKIFLGLITGIISGLFTSGGGLILIPAYKFLFKSSDKEARATTVFCILPMVIMSAILYSKNNYMNWHAAILCAIGGILGGFIGAKILNSINPIYLRIILIIFLIYSGIKFI